VDDSRGVEDRTTHREVEHTDGDRPGHPVVLKEDIAAFRSTVTIPPPSFASKNTGLEAFGTGATIHSAGRGGPVCHLRPVACAADPVSVSRAAGTGKGDVDHGVGTEHGEDDLDRTRSRCRS